MKGIQIHLHMDINVRQSLRNIVQSGYDKPLKANVK